MSQSEKIEARSVGFAGSSSRIATKLLIVLVSTVLSGLVGEAYGGIFYPDSEFDYYMGFRIGAMLGLFSSAIEVFYIRSSRRSWIRRVPFLTGLLVRVVVLTVAVRLVLVGNSILTQYLLGVEPGEALLGISAAEQVRDTVLSVAIVILFVILTQLSSIIGFRRFVNLVVGRYFRPVSENRVFMFVDIVGSTRLARSLGDVRFHDYLSEFFYQVDSAIFENGGEIVSYVGDAVIVTWPLTENRKKNARCLAALRSMSEQLDSNSAVFEREFGEKPAFRAAMHGGPVVVGECGDTRRQVTFLGDTPNLTSRIETVSKEQGEDFLASATLLEQLDLPHGVKAKSIGAFPIKGIDTPIELCRISFQ
ncbi:MAG: adenylate/guanylate cyclase domain-containing protein [Pseudomonadota bacterium]